MAQFTVRPASVSDAQAMAKLFAAVAGERDGIATEPPVDIDERAAQFTRTIAGSVVAVADSQVIGILHVEATRHGFGEIGMLVERASGGVKASGTGRFGGQWATSEFTSEHRVTVQRAPRQFPI